MKENFPIIDSHAHLCAAEFEPDLAEVLRRAREAGVGSIVTVSETLADARCNISLAREFPGLKPAGGLYPEFADPDEATRLLDFIREHRQLFYAVGEVGLDFWLAKDDAAREVQREVFSRFIDLARELDLPLNVHSRSAGRHAVAMLLAGGAARVQLHAFDAKAASALPAVAAGYFFSIPPSVVRSRQKQKLVKQLPLSCLLLESDSPVLGPDPASRNEPANAVIAARAIAEIKGVSYREVLEALRANTIRLYGEKIC